MSGKLSQIDIKSLQEKMAYTLAMPLEIDEFELATENYPKEFLNQIDSLGEEVTAVYQAGTYNRQYWFRLINCMQEQFPLLLCIMGLTEFNRLIIKYLTTHPSTDPNLNRLGGHLPFYLKNSVDNLEEKEPSNNEEPSEIKCYYSPSNSIIINSCVEMEMTYNNLFIRKESTGLNFNSISPHLKKIGEKKFIFREDIFGFNHQYLLQPFLLPSRKKKLFSDLPKWNIKKQKNAFFMFTRKKKVHCISAVPEEIDLFIALKSGSSLNDAMSSLLQNQNKNKEVVHSQDFLKNFMEKIGMFEWLKAIE